MIIDTFTVHRNLSGNQSYWWRVRARNVAGFGPFSEVRHFTIVITSVSLFDGIPQEYSLSQNYPNPFNPTTTIFYELPKQTRVTIKIFNMLGKEIASLVDEVKGPGRYDIDWNASGFASGVYFYKLQTGSYTSVKKLVLLR